MELLKLLAHEKQAMGPCGGREVKEVALCVWFVLDFVVTWIYS